MNRRAISYRARGVVAGLAVLTLRGVSVGYGEVLTFLAALLYAGHIVGLGAWSAAEDAMGMTIVQLAVIET